MELPEFNDSFNYYRNVNALYSILPGRFGAFTYQAGVRAEQTVTQTELMQTGERNRQNYMHLFPGAFFSYEIND